MHTGIRCACNNKTARNRSRCRELRTGAESVRVFPGAIHPSALALDSPLENSPCMAPESALRIFTLFQEERHATIFAFPSGFASAGSGGPDAQEDAPFGMKPRAFKRQPRWYLDAVIYQVHVKSFFDGNEDGSGDLPGLIQKLDYIRELGVTALWLLPFYPSPLRDDGYDISDYMGVHPTYGTLDDFRTLLQEAHARGIYVITELVINHTSDQHPWFQRARVAAPGSTERDFYVWSDDPERYQDARIIFKDFEPSNWTWDSIGNAYYWHRFYSHQPDLNFDSPAVHEAVLQVLDFWLGMGVDGLRLDAVPYLYEREGTSCENLPETHAFLRKLSAYVRKHYDERMLLAEANQWPEDAAAYFGKGDECQMAFHFPLMPRLYMAVAMEDRFPIVDILEQTPQLPEGCQWAIFLRNHDELTLEMLTDEERDYMVRVYAHDRRARINLGIRRRLAPLMANNRRKLELLNNLLLSLPGAPILYYGDEIGMGDNFYLGDRNGVRTPMQWSPDRNAGFSRANSQRLFLPVIIDPEYHYETVNVENQEHNPSSLLWWLRRRIALRNRHAVFSRGETVFLASDNVRVLAFLRRAHDDAVLVVANLSEHPQTAALGLAEWAGSRPIELTGQTPFPAVEADPYRVMLGSYDVIWLKLSAPGEAVEPDRFQIRSLPPARNWRDLLHPSRIDLWQSALPLWLSKSGLAEASLEPVCHFALPGLPPESAALVLARNTSAQGNGSWMALPLMFVEAAASPPPPAAVVARVQNGSKSGWLCDAASHPDGAAALARMLITPSSLQGPHGVLKAWSPHPLADVPEDLNLRTVPLAENSSRSATISFQDFGVLKWFRQLPEGVHPDPEITLFLGEWAHFEGAPRVLGMLEWQPEGGETCTVAYLQQWVRADRSAWDLFCDVLAKAIESVEVDGRLWSQPPALGNYARPSDFETWAEPLQEALGGHVREFLILLGERVAALHLALASDSDVPEFEPEPFTWHYQQAAFQAIRSLMNRHYSRLQYAATHWEAPLRELAQEVLEGRDAVLARIRPLRERKIETSKIRIHGNLTLSQILFTGKDFVLQAFEGDPHFTPEERRHKYSALRDVATLIRSFQAAAEVAGRRHTEQRSGDFGTHHHWARVLGQLAAGVCYRAYLGRAAHAPFLPATEEDRNLLLEAFLLEKALHELGRALDASPEAQSSALRGLIALQSR